MPTSSLEYRSFLKGGRFDDGSSLLELTPGERFAKAVHSDGLNASIEVPTSEFLPTPLEQRDVAFNDSLSGAPWTPYDPPQSPSPRIRPVHLSQLFPNVPMQESVAPYIRESTPLAYNLSATQVAENAAKPQTKIEFTGKVNPAVKTAAFVEVTSEVLDDGPGLAAFLDIRLRELLAIRWDDQIMNGNGTPPQLTGIIADPAVLTESTGATARAVILEAISDVEENESQCDSLLLNPSDYWTIYNVDSNFFTRLQEAGIRPVRSMAVTALHALVGCFAQAATLRVRQQMTVKLATQHQNNFVTNQLVLLAELRSALNITSPDLLSYCTIPATP